MVGAEQHFFPSISELFPDWHGHMYALVRFVVSGLLAFLDTLSCRDLLSCLGFRVLGYSTFLKEVFV